MTDHWMGFAKDGVTNEQLLEFVRETSEKLVELFDISPMVAPIVTGLMIDGAVIAKGEFTSGQHDMLTRIMGVDYKKNHDFIEIDAGLED